GYGFADESCSASADNCSAATRVKWRRPASFGRLSTALATAATRLPARTCSTRLQALRFAERFIANCGRSPSWQHWLYRTCATLRAESRADWRPRIID